MRKKHFTLIEIMIVVAIIALLALIALPNFIQARKSARKTTCIANLRQIHGAKQTWVIQENESESATPESDDIAPYFTGSNVDKIRCPLDSDKTFATSYDIKSVAENPVCKIQPTGDDAHEL